MRRIRPVAAITGAVATGGLAAALLFGSSSVFAASPSTATSTATATAVVSTTTTTTTPPAGGLVGAPDPDEDNAIVAKTIGISTTDLQTALSSGKTMAAVATANGVDPQKVIDALVQDELTEIADAVTAGTITQTQADASKANVTQMLTDRVNGVMPSGGPGCPGGAAPSTSGSTSGSSSSSTTTTN